jgi:CRISPR-associated protein Csh2
MGKSLHAVNLQFMKGTGAFASKQGATRKTFREEYVVSYSLIGFYGIINENAGKHTGLTETDILDLKKAMWMGTKGLISRSKFGQMPRLMLSIRYNEPDFFIGELDNRIRLQSDMVHAKMRSPEDYSIDITELTDSIDKAKDHIESVSFIVDDKLRFTRKSENVELKKIDLFKDESAEVLK